MIPKIQTSAKFKEEYSSYQKKISLVNDKRIQAELLDSLLQLKSQVQFLDRCHDQIFISGKLPSDVADIRSAIAKHRKNIDSKLASWERSQATVKPAPLPSEE
jgi:hypothetical protein